MAVFGILIVILAHAARVQAGILLTNGLVAYYPFNGNANDAAGNGNNGTVVGTDVMFSADRFGNPRSALFLNTTSTPAWNLNGAYVVVPPVAGLDFNRDFTVSLWVNLSDIPNTQRENLISDGQDANSFGLAVDLVYLAPEDDMLGFGWNANCSWVSQPLSRNVWWQATLVRSGASASLFKNGSFLANCAPPATASNAALWFGRYPDIGGNGSWYPLVGGLDDIRFYNRALSAGEVQQLYVMEATPPCAPYEATAAAAVVDGFVVLATVADGGCGYTNTPGVTIIGDNGSGAEAVAVVSNGVVVAVNIVDAGNGYSTAPAVVIAPPFIPQPTMSIAALSLLSFSNLAAGANYQLQSLAGGTWSNVGSTFGATTSTFTQLVSGTVAPSGYRLAALPLPQQAYATVQVVDGFVIAASVTSGGSGYTASPAVTILNDAGGSNATATATVSGGIVTGITLTSAGIGYLSAPTLVIAPPPANALSPSVTPVMELSFASLSPYDSYQLQFTPVANGAWTNLGAPFTCTSSTNTQSVNLTGKAGFFRVRYVP